MNITLLIGLTIFWSAIFYAAIESAGFDSFINILSILIVVVGTLSTVIMSYSGYELKQLFKSMLKALGRTPYDNKYVIERLNLYSGLIKKDGVLSIENDFMEEENYFLKKVMKNMIDSENQVEILNKYTIYSEELYLRHERNWLAYENIGSVAGSMGMIGTLIGLIGMLLKMNDPSAIGPSMAVALLTTFYGALIANGFSSAIASNLRNMHNEEELQIRIILQGAKMIGENITPTLIKETLLSMLDKKSATKIEI